MTEPGVWRSAPVRAAPFDIPTFHYPGLIIDAAYVQKGESLSLIGIYEDTVLYAEMAARSEVDELVIVQRENQDGLIELSAKVKTLQGYKLRHTPGITTVREPADGKYREVEIAVVRYVLRRLRQPELRGSAASCGFCQNNLSQLDEHH